MALPTGMRDTHTTSTWLWIVDRLTAGCNKFVEKVVERLEVGRRPVAVGATDGDDTLQGRLRDTVGDADRVRIDVELTDGLAGVCERHGRGDARVAVGDHDRDVLDVYAIASSRDELVLDQRE